MATTSVFHVLAPHISESLPIKCEDPGMEEREEGEFDVCEEKEECKRNELKRPDLKGTFRCSICQKIFCHSSSLSRHRMQAHFKSYRCTICKKEITSNETLRAHMYKEHEVSRMFMCRCCNWAFPDKTSLHVHIQSKEESKRSSLQSIPSLSNGLPSAFAPLQSSLNSSPLPVLPLSFPVPPVLPQSDLLARLQDRLLLNSLLTLPTSFSFPFLPSSTFLSSNEEKSPSTEVKEEEDEDEEIEVRDNDDDGETPAKKMHMDTKSIVSRQSSVSEKRADSPSSGSSSSVFSPSHIDRLLSPSPSDRQKELPSLNLDPSLSSSFSGHPHVSPSETHSTASPQCESSHSSCFDCNLLRARILSQDNKISFLESRIASNQDEMSSTLSSLRVAESTVISLRSALLSCQEEALRFARCENAADSQAVMRFLNQILQSTIIR